MKYITFKQALNTPVMHTNKRLRVHQTYLGFDRRATALAWHPTNPNVVAVGSKGGDIILWNYQADGNKPRTFIKGVRMCNKECVHWR